MLYDSLQNSYALFSMPSPQSTHSMDWCPPNPPEISKQTWDQPNTSPPSHLQTVYRMRSTNQDCTQYHITWTAQNLQQPTEIRMATAHYSRIAPHWVIKCNRCHPHVNGTHYYIHCITTIWRAVLKIWNIRNQHLYAADSKLCHHTQLQATVLQIFHNIQQDPMLQDMLSFYNTWTYNGKTYLPHPTLGEQLPQPNWKLPESSKITLQTKKTRYLKLIWTTPMKTPIPRSWQKSYISTLSHPSSSIVRVYYCRVQWGYRYHLKWDFCSETSYDGTSKKRIHKQTW